MTTIYLASYKSTQDGFKGLLNRFIRWATKSQYSHTEVCIGNPFESAVDCLSAVSPEGGVRIKSIHMNPNKWDILPMPGVTEADVRAFYAEHAGKKYDFIGCVRTMLPWVGREHPDHFFCSEVAASIWRHAEPWRMYPGVMHSTLERGKHGNL